VSGADRSQLFRVFSQDSADARLAATSRLRYLFLRHRFGHFKDELIGGQLSRGRQSFGHKTVSAQNATYNFPRASKRRSGGSE